MSRANINCDVIRLAEVLTAAICFAATGLAQETDRIETIDGRPVAGAITSIGDGGRLKLADGKSFAWSKLRRIEPRFIEAAAPAQDAPAIRLQMTGGGQILATRFELSDETCRFDWRWGRGAKLPIDLLVAVQLQPGPISAEFHTALAAKQRLEDVVVVQSGDRTQTIAGLLEKVTGDTVTLQWQGKSRDLPRAKVSGIVLAAGLPPGGKGASCRVNLRDGAWLVGRTLTLNEGQAQLDLGQNSAISFPWTAVAAVEIESSRVVYLSDLKPSREEQRPVLTLAMPARRDLSVARGPLTLKGADGREATFRKGWGVHAYSRLEFDIGGEYELLLATIGIDAQAKGRGVCNFAVWGDGRRLETVENVKAADAPRKLRIDVRGIRRLSLVVEPGRDFDLADHANWCDARLVRPAQNGPDIR